MRIIAALVLASFLTGCAGMVCVPKAKLRHWYEFGARCGF